MPDFNERLPDISFSAFPVIVISLVEFDEDTGMEIYRGQTELNEDEILEMTDEVTE
jgi:hypothetical protein